ncbi:MAG: SLBB domain-containing protein [Bacteroidota bacterium]
MKKTMSILFVVLPLFFLSITYAQQYSPEEIKAKLKELGMTEEEARRKAKELGINLEDLLKGSTTQAGTKAEVTQPSTTPVEVKVIPPPSSVISVPAPAVQDTTSKVGLIQAPASVARDTTPPPKGREGLDYFGYDIFKHIPAAFEPNAVGPVDPGYLVGPGDVLRLTVWGEAEFQYELEVDREGRIFIPNVGQVFVMGTPLNTLEDKLKKQLSKYYSGLATRPPRAFMDVSITKLRPLRIFVMGEVKQPGGYTISSYATVFNALYGVGGPLVRGSLRNVKVLRDNKVVATVDLYDYLLRGDQTSDVRLQNNDLVFIAPRGKTVSIRGEVLRPAIYELKENEHLATLINYAGGLLSTAYLDHAQIDRVKPFEERTKGTEDRAVVDISLKDSLGKGGKDVALYDADDVQIFSILDEKKNFVSIQGAVWRPGRYELGKIRTIKDVIAAAEGVKPDTYLGKGDLERVRPDLTREFLTFDVAKALKGEREYDLELRAKDAVRLYSIHEIEFEKTVSVSGHVKYPQTIPYADSLTLYDLVFKAGGLLDPEFQKSTYLERADLVRLNSDMITKRIIPFNLQRLLDDSTYNIHLQPRDEVIVYGIGVTEVTDKYVTINGHVKSPGKYPLRSNMTLNDLVLLAGGFTEDASLLEAEVSRIRPEGLREDSLSIILHPKLTRDFAQEVSSEPLNELSRSDPPRNGDFYLQYMDQVLIRPNPNYTPQQSVSVEGEVMYPGIYVIQHRGERLSEILSRAGGPTKIAYLGGAQFYRGGKRLVIDFEEAYHNKDEDHDIMMLAGDRVTIPPRPRTVLVTGEVNNPGLQVFIDGQSVSDYLDRAGGRTDSAQYALLTLPTGETKKVSFGWLSRDPNVLEGSAIVVTKQPAEPPKEKKEFDLGATIKDSFAIVASAATIIYLVSQVKK